MADEVELTVVTMQFETRDPSELEPHLARYVVAARGHPGCRNIDLCTSEVHPGRFLVVQKWTSPAAQQAHFDSDDMVEMAEGCDGLLVRPPDIDLLAPVSAHDLW